ncbi:hypothetical protein SCD_n02822 [Sulfuricella denitrificans skB26]|uniref:PEP-CTERM protein-sorting domain-containing protein n=1 Tax=Sulfuricella denitrificans (strain DSM 22764 / NBRC 105220 / skB26) TaxID=1163617 RepID=S6AJS4_SULDS|nr:hypothetical protein SCD_n02822 [Sulfuricella denitrificans skB26]
MDFRHLKKLLLAALFTSAILSSSAMASYLSDGSSGVFHPLVDATLDLSDPAVFPQFSNVYIDAGIRVTVLTPGTGYGYLLSADGIYLNGIFDTGAGSVSLNAINSIVMGSGSQLIGGSLALSAINLILRGEIKATDSATVNSGGNLIDLNGGRISMSSPVPLPAASILFGSGLLGLLSLVAGRRRR